LIERMACFVVLVLFAAAGGAEVVPVVHAPQPQSAMVVSVGDFLTDGSGNAVPAYRAFQAAIESAREKKAARLVIPPGRYVFSDPEIATSYGHLVLADLSDLEIDGQGAELVFTNQMVQGIVLAMANRIVIRNLSIEYAGTLASPGVATKLPDGRTAIRIDDRYPAGPSTAFEAVSGFDVAARRWKKNEVYRVRTATMIAPQTFTAPEFSRFPDGSEVLVRHRVYGANAIAGFLPSLNDVAFEDVTIYSAPGMAFFFASTGKGVRLTRCVVRPKEDALISVTADGAHFVNTGGHIIIEDCDFSGQGDDGVNIGAHWLQPVGQPGPATLDLAFAYRSTYYQDCVVAGMELSFHDRATLREFARRRVLSVSQDGARRQYRVVLDAPIELEGTPLIGLDPMNSSVYVIRNNRFHDHRGRGMLLQASRGRVENNLVRSSSLSCLSIATDAVTFFEGFGARGLVIADNRFEDCNGAGARLLGGQSLAAVNILAEVPSGFSSEHVHQGVVFERNQISDTPGLALLIASAREVELRNNSIVDANAQPVEPGGVEPMEAQHSVLVTRASQIRIVGLAERTTKPTYGSGVYVDPETTSDVVISAGRRRAAGTR
jgi:hypothetical protein